MKNLVGYLLGTLLALSVTAPLAQAAVAPGTKCSKVGTKQVYKGKTYACIKLGKNLYWNNGVKVASPNPTKNFTPSPAPAPSSSSIPNVLPVLSETYFGQKSTIRGVFADNCWYAKKASNSSSKISVAVRQVSEVIGPDGTVKGSIWWMIPSLLPGESNWFSSYFGSVTNSNGCTQLPSRIYDKDVTTLSGGGPLEEIRLTTLDSEKPKVLGVIQEPGSTQGTVIYKLRVLNQSLDKEISDKSFINFIFLDSSGRPIWAESGAITGKVPPNGEALLSAWDFYIKAIVIPPGTTRVVGSLNFVLCKRIASAPKDICSY